MTEEQIKRYTYTKEEVNMLVQAAVAEAREMDTVLMAKHNRNATIISMILGLICLALDVNVIDDIIERVERDVIPQLQKYQRYIPGI